MKRYHLPDFQELLFNFGIGRMRVESFVERYLEATKKDKEVLNIDEIITENQKRVRHQIISKG